MAEFRRSDPSYRALYTEGEQYYQREIAPVGVTPDTLKDDVHTLVRKVIGTPIDPHAYLAGLIGVHEAFADNSALGRGEYMLHHTEAEQLIALYEGGDIPDNIIRDLIARAPVLVKFDRHMDDGKVNRILADPRMASVHQNKNAGTLSGMLYGGSGLLGKVAPKALGRKIAGAGSTGGTQAA